MRPVIQTSSGRFVNLEDPDPRTLHINDIAHALSQINRFTGHTKFPWNVAQHSLLVADLCRQEDPGLEIDGLLHDAHEAYIGDASSPLKLLLPDYNNLEGMWRGMMQTRFGQIRYGRVKPHDRRALAAEKYMQMPHNDEENHWELIRGIDQAWPAHSAYILSLTMKEAALTFANRFYELTSKQY